MTPEQALWVRVQCETFELVMRELEQERREIAELVSRFPVGETRAAWERKGCEMEERRRRVREAWDRAVAEIEQRVR